MKSYSHSNIKFINWLSKKISIDQFEFNNSFVNEEQFLYNKSLNEIILSSSAYFVLDRMVRKLSIPKEIQSLTTLGFNMWRSCLENQQTIVPHYAHLKNTSKFELIAVKEISDYHRKKTNHTIRSLLTGDGTQFAVGRLRYL